MDPKEPEIINPLKSSTIRAGIQDMILGVLTIIAYLTGYVFDIALVQHVIEGGLIAATGAYGVWNGWKVVTGRMRATELIGGKLAEKLREKGK